MSFNLIRFITSALCHSTKKLPGICFHLDRIGIILHIWATSLSVLLLECRNTRPPGYITLVITFAGSVSATYLDPRMRKRQQIQTIGGFGAFTLFSVLLYNIVNVRVSRLTASYVTMVVINSAGGWLYSRESNIYICSRSRGPFFISGHSLMHICSLVASSVHSVVLVSYVCFWSTLGISRVYIYWFVRNFLYVSAFWKWVV
jgi:Haemolysin-III related